jgi:hypothetical protein
MIVFGHRKTDPGGIGLSDVENDRLVTSFSSYRKNGQPTHIKNLRPGGERWVYSS